MDVIKLVFRVGLPNAGIQWDIDVPNREESQRTLMITGPRHTRMGGTRVGGVL